MINQTLHSKHILKWLLLIIAFHTFGEGTRELQPEEGDFGYLHITKHESFTDFGHYDADPTNQIKIRVNEVGETVYYGLNNMTEGDNVFVPDVPYRIVSPSGVIVEEGVIPDVGEQGNIPNWGEAVAGPASLVGAGGYDDLNFVAGETGDYVLEFDIEAIDEREVHIQYFDVTVASPAGEEIPGRLYSEGWQLTTGSHDNGFDGSVYPYDSDDGGTVYKVSFDDLSPFTFVLNFNSFGIEDTGNFFEDRKSQDGIHFSPQHKIFFNPPDSTVFPTDEQPDIEFLGTAELVECGANDYCLTFYANDDGYVEGFIDISNTNSYDPDIDIHFAQEIAEGDTICIPWDGRDANGDFVSADEIRVMSSMGQNPMHIPMYDIEDIVNGIWVEIMRPQGMPQPKLFWDDTEVSGGNALDGLVNLEGCTPTDDMGCHRWTDRGVFDDSPVEGSETINTWWYSNLVEDTVIVQTFVNRQIRLTYTPGEESGKDTTVCEKDTITFYVLQEETDHFDTDYYTYNWYQDGNLLTGEENNPYLELEADDVSEVVVEARSVSDDECVYYDTLTLSTEPPVQINATVEDETCEEYGSIVIDEIIQGPPDISYNWVDYPDSSGASLINLEGGVYQVVIADESFSENCALDTLFSLDTATQINIDTIILSDSRCFEVTGSAEVQMEDPNVSYEFTLNGESQGSQTVYEPIYIGQYTLEVATTQGALCTTDTTFEIEGIRDSLIFDTTHITCEGDDGRIEIEPLPDPDLVTLTWDDGSNDGYTRTGLAPDEYLFSVEVPGVPFCDVDTSTILELRDAIAIDEVDTTTYRCFVQSGSATVTMVTNQHDYQYSFDGDGFNNENFRENLTPGTYDVVVETTSGVCADSNEFEIEGIRRPLVFDTTHITCEGNNGSIDIEALPEPGLVTLTWADGSNDGYSRTGLSPGDYEFSAEAPNTSFCDVDTSTTLELRDDIAIDEIDTSASSCFVYDGSASVTMVSADYDYQYSFDGDGFDNENFREGLAPGTYNVVVETAGGICSDTAPFTIEAGRLNIEASTTSERCIAENGSIQVTQATPAITIQWHDNDPADFTRDNVSTGNYSFTIENPDIAGCEADTTVQVGHDTYDLDPSFSIEEEINDGVYDVDENLTFINTSSISYDSISWSFGDGSVSNAPQPVYAYAATGEYFAELYLEDEYGCNGNEEKLVVIEEVPPCEAVLPNAFSPNGDNINDDIGVIGNVKSMDLKIFNRWGEVIFRSDSPEERWDGYYRGQEVPIGVYPYTLRYSCLRAGDRIETFEEVGEITLVR